jgi:hypothetical protein
MTHDWFSHLEDGRNQPEYMGCRLRSLPKPRRWAAGRTTAWTGRSSPTAARRAPSPSTAKPTCSAPYEDHRNTNTAWWDASQIYGYDETSARAGQARPGDPAKLLMLPRGDRARRGRRQGYLPLLQPTDPMNPAWAGQEATGFPDNWSIGMSFYHNVFVREHNAFVDEFRGGPASPDADSGPAQSRAARRASSAYADVTDDELFEVARLVVCGRDRQDPHHRVDHPAALQRAAVPGHERQLERPVPGQSEIVRKALARVVDGLNESQPGHRQPVVFGVRLRPGIVGLGSRTSYAKFGLEKGRLEPHNPRRQRRGQPLRLAVQLPRGVHHRLPPAPAAARPARVPRAGRRSQRDPAKVPVVDSFRGKARRP